MNEITPYDKILLPKSADDKTTTLLVDIHYTASFCDHLKKKGIKYTQLPEKVYPEGYEKGIKFRQTVWFQIVIEYTGDIGNLLLGWDIPSLGM